jgi:hypothetical protein
MAAYNRIDIGAVGERPNIEKKATTAITPGHLLLRVAGGVRTHNVAGGHAPALFAKQDIYSGKTIADAYAANDVVQVLAAQKGEEVWAWLAGGQNVAEGAALTSNGDGTLKAASVQLPAADLNGDEVVAYAEQALNLTDIAAARIVVRVR